MTRDPSTTEPAALLVDRDEAERVLAQIFLRVSGGNGICASFIGWSKSWCGQSEANTVVSAPS
jgi:hypothetical protein